MAKIYYQEDCNLSYWKERQSPLSVTEARAMPMH